MYLALYSSGRRLTNIEVPFLTFSNVSLGDDFQVEIRDESGRHLAMARFVIHGQLDDDRDDHPAAGAQVHQHLLQDITFVTQENQTSLLNNTG